LYKCFTTTKHEELAKECTFFIEDCEQPTYPKNTGYPLVPLQPLPSLEEFELSHTIIWWPLGIVLSDIDWASLEAQTVAQRASQIWHDAHSKKLSASQVGHVLSRKRQTSMKF
jgi:hypothetical protein